jgi:hypothetical protein
MQEVQAVASSIVLIFRESSEEPQGCLIGKADSRQNSASSVSDAVESTIGLIRKISNLIASAIFWSCMQSTWDGNTNLGCGEP